MTFIQWLLLQLAGCEDCDNWLGIRWEDSRTNYHWDGEGEDPNRPRRLCRPCAAEHHEHWDEMWAQARNW